ncbi:MAG: hypothetical protein ABFS86_12180 [Planctomycetota bacterium]
MRTRSQWLVGGVVAALLAFVLVGSAAAGLFDLGLSSDDDVWYLGGEANLDVTVDPALVGGYGTLVRKIGGDQTILGTFDFTSTCFSITAPIPSDPMYAGMNCRFRYFAFTEDGVGIGGSPIAKKPAVPLEIE